MLPDQYRWIVDEFEPEGDAAVVFEIGKRLETDGNLEGAATAYDRAFGLDPRNGDVCRARGRVLDALEVVEHGLRFRYVPGGSFLMGSLDGDADERPYHPVWLSPYWVSETPLSWVEYCRALDWQPPPLGVPQGDYDDSRFRLYNVTNPLRLTYCEDETIRGQDWHCHIPPEFRVPVPNRRNAQFPVPQRRSPESPWTYESKPIVAITWQEAAEVAERLCSSSVHFALPTEAQWEKAARGGLIATPYAWGGTSPNPSLCDFGRFHQFSIQPTRSFPCNGYGLYAMNGCVWEWTRDWYDRDYYSESVLHDPQGPPHGKERVLRGGSWADCTAVVTNTFRTSLPTPTEEAELWARRTYAPTIGFRLVREVVQTP